MHNGVGVDKMMLVSEVKIVTTKMLLWARKCEDITRRTKKVPIFSAAFIHKMQRLQNVRPNFISPNKGDFFSHTHKFTPLFPSIVPNTKDMARG
jgi:hypothetical protein